MLHFVLKQISKMKEIVFHNRLREKYDVTNRVKFIEEEKRFDLDDLRRGKGIFSSFS